MRAGSGAEVSFDSSVRTVPPILLGRPTPRSAENVEGVTFDEEEGTVPLRAP